MDKSSFGVAEFMYELVCHHRASAIHIFDQGWEFFNQVLDEFNNLTEIRHNITSAYHPQANGEVDRFNRMMQECLAKCQEFNQNLNSTSQPDWHKKLHSVLLVYQVRKQASTRISPFQMMYGCEAILCWEHEKWAENPDIEYTQENLAMEEMVAKVGQIWEKVLDTTAANIKKAQEYQAKYYNARLAKNNSEIGDKVWHVNTAIKGRKAKGIPWVGLYTVIGRTETGNYMLKDKHGHEWKKAVPPNQLKKFNSREDSNVPSNDSDSDSEMDVPLPVHLETQLVWPNADLEVSQILADLADGGAIERVDEVEVDMEQVQVQEIKIQVADKADEPVKFQDKTMEEVDADILITGVTPAEKPTVFHPFSPFQQKSIAAKFGLAVGRSLQISHETLCYKGLGEICTQSFQECTVAGDGNCFFRSISYLLLGTEEKHNVVYSKIVEYISESANWDKLKTFIQEYTCGLD